MTPEDEVSKEMIKGYEDYVESFKNMGEETSTLMANHDRPPFLRRNLQSNILPNDMDVHSGLEHKICLHTYKLFYVIGTEEYMYIPRKRRTRQ